MQSNKNVPSEITFEFFNADASAVQVRSLGPEFLQQHNVLPERANRPFRVAVGARQSKHGNAYYTYRAPLELPGELETRVRVEGTEIP